MPALHFVLLPPVPLKPPLPLHLTSCLLSPHSKPLTYGLVLDELGEDAVHQHVGQEPSGRMFNELVLDHNKKPHNPMINAGAIIVCSLLQTLAHKEMNLAERFDHVKQYFSVRGEMLGMEWVMTK